MLRNKKWFLIILSILIFMFILLSAEEEEEEKKPEYVGYKKCKTCHKDIYDSWKETTHALNFQGVLDSTGLDDTTCFSCHTVGYGEPGGFVDTTETPDLVGVQCESCHGPGSLYKKFSIMKDHEKSVANGLYEQTEEVCTKCHTKDQSPDFNYEEAVKDPKGVHIIPEKEE
ncbi:hypothetical protein KAW96_00690 [candidate division WOR-3 bacterium]|nr:hypothetical protein [candidate division WOR-3 bacterium]